jgi:hypothetical protein
LDDDTAARLERIEQALTRRFELPVVLLLIGYVSWLLFFKLRI